MNELSIFNPSKDIEFIDSKIRAIIGDVQNYKHKTNGMFGWSPTTANININRVSDIHLLLSILGFLIDKQEKYDKAATLTGLNTYPPSKWLDTLTQHWIDDVTARIKFVSHQEEVTELESIKKQLFSHVSEEDKKRREQELLKEKMDSIKQKFATK